MALNSRAAALGAPRSLVAGRPAARSAGRRAPSHVRAAKLDDVQEMSSKSGAHLRRGAPRY
jgi:hypothetical protein